MDDQPRKCENCEYYADEEVRAEGSGRCHLEPRQWVYTEGFHGWRYPIQQADDWCGGFVQRIIGKMTMEVEGDVGGAFKQRRDDKSVETGEY